MTQKFFGKNVARVSNDPGNSIGVVMRTGAREAALTPAQHALARQLAKAGNGGLQIAAETAAFDVAALNHAGLRVVHNTIERRAIMHGELNEPVGFLIDANAAAPARVERTPWPSLTREVQQPDNANPWKLPGR